MAFDFIKSQLLSTIEWENMRDDQLFFKWPDDEIKKGSKLIIRQGQDAIFYCNGRIEGVFETEGTFDVESEVIPFLSTLKSFAFGFNTPLRAEVLFINTRNFNIKWGAGDINLPFPNCPGGLPIRANGSYEVKIVDNLALIENLAGIQQTLFTDNIKGRLNSSIKSTLTKHIMKTAPDMLQIQAFAEDIGVEVAKDLSMKLSDWGLKVISFNIESVTYPESIKKMQEKAGAQAMIGDVNKYTALAYADQIDKGNFGGRSSGGMMSGAGNVANTMIDMQMGIMMGQQMMNSINAANQNNQNNQNPTPASTQNVVSNGNSPKFCPECGTPTNGAKFCSNCGTKLI